MPEYPKITAKEAEKILLENGFEFKRQKGSHRIYAKGDILQVLPFHSGKTLHPKIVKQIFESIEK
ncbi:addiction module toxin, HicA family [Helicobacter sp. MIT 11-5569]|uniref:type II toxin-antitoxin system HicA family toxin n=1 Tax=Helicobacter sp. MIT 11-5569 TaxID=1548151 RepID=UPI00051FB33F|nr:type II toxin-antitoxin system HicA family toxin [Helicobacter sp. MIT 11-5569]TLD85199.1 addiction module toxin, HicA family [Helicobacter sp. MIT 11-5569]